MANKEELLDTLRELKTEINASRDNEGDSKSPEMSLNACSVLATALEQVLEIMEFENKKKKTHEVSAQFASNTNMKLLSLEKQNEDLAKAIMLLNKNYSTLKMMNETMRNDLHQSMVSTQQEFDGLKNEFEVLKTRIFSDMNSHLNDAVIPNLGKCIKSEIVNDLKSMYSAMVHPDRFEKLYQMVIAVEEQKSVLMREVNEATNISKNCEYSLHSIKQRLTDINTQFQDSDQSIKSNFNERLLSMNQRINDEIKKDIQSIHSKLTVMDSNQRVIETEHSNLFNNFIENPMLKKYVTKVVSEQEQKAMKDSTMTVKSMQEMESTVRNSVNYCQELTAKMEDLFSNTVNIDVFQQKMQSLQHKIDNLKAK